MMYVKAKSFQLFATCCLASLLVTLSGCSQSTATTATQPAKGKVTMGGAPVKGALVTLNAKSSSKAVNATGTTGDDGTFTLSTFEEGDGAAEGQYDVTVTATDASGNSVIDPKYADPATSGLTVTIKAGQNDLDLKVEKAP